MVVEVVGAVGVVVAVAAVVVAAVVAAVVAVVAAVVAAVVLIVVAAVVAVVLPFVGDPLIHSDQSMSLLFLSFWIVRSQGSFCVTMVVGVVEIEVMSWGILVVFSTIGMVMGFSVVTAVFPVVGMTPSIDQ